MTLFEPDFPGLSESQLVTYFPVAEISYTLTLDADLQATRVASRGLFSENNERTLTVTATVSSAPLCVDYQVYVQVKRGRLSGGQRSPAPSGSECVTKSGPLSLGLPQEAPDFVSSLSMKVEAAQRKANVNPVLDQFSPSAWEFFVSDAWIS